MDLIFLTIKLKALNFEPPARQNFFGISPSTLLTLCLNPHVIYRQSILFIVVVLLLFQTVCRITVHCSLCKIVHTVLQSPVQNCTHIIAIGVLCRTYQMKCNYSVNEVQMQCKCSTNAVQMQFKCSTNAVQMQYKCSVNAVQMRCKCSANAVHMQCKCSANTM